MIWEILFILGLILLGCVMDATSILFITTPLLFPIVVALGYDGIWFGVMMVMLIQLGLIHPDTLIFNATLIPAIAAGLFAGRWCVTRIPQRIFDALLLAFSTASSSATLPVSLSAAQNRLGVPKEIASFMLPAGATLNKNGAETIMVQRFVPEVVKGDKRVLVIGGKVFGHCLARIPKAGETRGNLAAGGKGGAQPISERDREIAEGVGRELVKDGIVFAGLDVIGDCLTEVNVTSPTGIVEIAQQTGHDAAKALFDELA